MSDFQTRFDQATLLLEGANAHLINLSVIFTDNPNGNKPPEEVIGRVCYSVSQIIEQATNLLYEAEGCRE